MNKLRAIGPLVMCTLFALGAVACASSADDPEQTDQAAEDQVAPGAPHDPTCGRDCLKKCTEPGRYLVTSTYVIDEDHAGRLWERKVPATMAWADAKAYCDGLNVDGETGWSLPNEHTLASILYKPGGLDAGDPKYCDPAIDQAAFPHTPPDFFWTSQHDNREDVATYVNFFDGRTHNDVMESPHNVRCVHPN